MSLIAKIKAERDSNLLAESERRLTEERNKRAKEIQLLGLVTETLGVVSERLEEEFEPLGESIGLPKYYRMGDVVVAVQLFTNSRDELPDPSRPTLALVEYYAALVAVNPRSGSIETIRVGTLRWLDYNGFYKAMTSAPGHLLFDAKEVLPVLRIRGNIP